MIDQPLFSEKNNLLGNVIVNTKEEFLRAIHEIWLGKRNLVINGSISLTLQELIDGFRNAYDNPTLYSSPEVCFYPAESLVFTPSAKLTLTEFEIDSRDFSELGGKDFILFKANKVFSLAPSPDIEVDAEDSFNLSGDFYLFKECNSMIGVEVQGTTLFKNLLSDSDGVFIVFGECKNLVNCIVSGGFGIGTGLSQNYVSHTEFGRCSNLANCSGDYSYCSGVSLSCSGRMNNCTSEVPEGLKITCKGEFTYS